ncbi:MAG TPA: hypothetical protein VK421_05435 [Pyrinomonadaceae bacterium]|nr:hypothetical protein [Pyrinomonadaceae bacterium]
MKYLLLLAVFLFVALLVYWRLRPYIHMARRAFGFVRDVRRFSRQDLPGTAPRHTAAASGERLVRCSSCGTWLPSSRALAARSSAEVYCSTDCLERSALGGSRPRAAGDKL